MSVSDTDFYRWLGRVQHDNADLVLNVREVGIEAPDTLYVGRRVRQAPHLPDTWGNPYPEWKHGRLKCIKLYAAYVARMPENERLAFLLPIREALDSGKKLLCWCAPDACHAHVLAGWAKALKVAPKPVTPAEPTPITAPGTPTPTKPAAATAAATPTPIRRQAPTGPTPGPAFASKRP